MSTGTEAQTGNEMSQVVAQAMMLGDMQATIRGIDATSKTTLDLVRDQGQRIGQVEANDAKQDTRLDGHDREFRELRGVLDAINGKLDSRGLTWPKLLAGGAALAAILGTAIAAIVAATNGLNVLAEIAAKLGS